MWYNNDNYTSLVMVGEHVADLIYDLLTAGNSEIAHKYIEKLKYTDVFRQIVTTFYNKKGFIDTADTFSSYEASFDVLVDFATTKQEIEYVLNMPDGNLNRKLRVLKSAVESKAFNTVCNYTLSKIKALCGSYPASNADLMSSKTTKTLITDLFYLLVCNSRTFDYFIDDSGQCYLSARNSAPAIRADNMFFFRKLAKTTVSINPVMRISTFDELTEMISIIADTISHNWKSRSIFTLAINNVFDDLEMFLEAGDIPIETIEKQVIIMLQFSNRKCKGLVRRYPCLVRTKTLIKM